MKLFEKKRTRGAISIFLVIIIVPTMLFSAVLIDGSRMASARAITQEAADLAAASALTGYNQKLKDSYGLFAIQEPDKLEDIYKESLMATLMAGGLSENQEYSEKIWDILKSTVGAGNPYQGKQFLNLYDFSVDSCKVEPLYSLANQAVLENQMVEYAKFRGIYVVADRFDIVAHLGEVKEQAQKNKQTAEVMKEKIKVDEKNVAVERAVRELNDAIDELNASVSAVNLATETYVSLLSQEMEQIAAENTGSDEDDEQEHGNRNTERDYSRAQTVLKNALEKPDDAAKKVLKKAEKAKEEVEKAIQNLENFQERQKPAAAENENIQGMIEDAGVSIDEYKEFYLEKGIEPYLFDMVLDQLQDDHELGSNAMLVMAHIDEAIRRYIDEMPDSSGSGGDDEEDEEEEDPEYYFYYLNSSDKTTDIADAIGTVQGMKRYRPALRSGYWYFCEKTWDNLSPAVSAAQGEEKGSAIDETFAESQSAKEPDASDKEVTAAPRREIDKAVYQALPSRSKAWQETNKENKKSFFNKDGDLSSPAAMIDEGKNSMLLDLAEASRDDVLCLSYLFGTFKSRLTGVSKFSEEGMSQADKNSDYMPKWRKIHPGGEMNMRFTPKKDDKTVLRGELEYLIYGNRTDQANEDAVYATIYGERLVNNMIALYGNKDVKKNCKIAAAEAAVVSKALAIPIPSQVFFWIYLTAWSVAETYMDMYFLVSGGYRIPLLKTSANVVLKKSPSDHSASLISNYGKPDWSFVCYEDYLLILLLAKGEDKRIMRSMDLIEMNMKNVQSGFKLEQSYTYLKADTALSLRYLFGNVAPFQQTYQENGVSGRMKFTNTIYQGY